MRLSKDYLKYEGLICWVFIILFLILASIRASRSVFSPEEIIITGHIENLREAIAWARHDVLGPFVSVVTTIFNHLKPGNRFILRLPEVLAGGAAAGLFLFLIRQQNYRHLPLLIFLPLSVFSLGYFSSFVGPMIWLAGSTLALLYLSYLVFFDPGETNFWRLVLWSALLLVMPTFHFISLLTILAVDITLIILLVFQKKFLKIPILLFSNFFVMIHFIPWGDVVIKFFVDIFSYQKAPFGLWDVLVKIVSQPSFLGVLIICLAIILILVLIYQWLKAPNSFGILIKFNLVFLAIFLLLATIVAPFRPVLGQYYLILFWPIWFLIVSGLNALWQSRKPFIYYPTLFLVIIMLFSNLLWLIKSA